MCKEKKFNRHGKKAGRGMLRPPLTCVGEIVGAHFSIMYRNSMKILSDSRLASNLG